MGTKVKELKQVSLSTKNCTNICCVPNNKLIPHWKVWEMSKTTKVCPLKDGVEV